MSSKALTNHRVCRNRQVLLACAAILLAICFLFYKYVLQVFPSVMTGDLMATFQIHGAALGNLAATYFYAYMVVQVFSGPVLDRFGVRLIGSCALLCSAVGALLFAKAGDLLAAEVGRVLMGAGAAFATVTYFKIVASWFDARYFGFLGGLLSTAVMLGAVFGQVFLAHFVTVLGWRYAVDLCAVTGFSIALLFLFCVRDAANGADKSVQSSAHKVTWQAILTVLRRPVNWLLTLYSGLAFAPLAVFAGLWGNPFLVANYHLTTTEAASLTALAFIGFGVGGPSFGLLSDRYHNRSFWMYSGCVLTLISLLFVLYCPALNTQTLGVLMFLFGFGTSAFMLGFAMAKDCNALFLAATVIAMINTGDAVFGAVTEPLVGRLLDFGWHGEQLNHNPVFSVANYHHAFIILPVYLLLALLFLHFALKKHRTSSEPVVFA